MIYFLENSINEILLLFLYVRESVSFVRPNISFYLQLFLTTANIKTTAVERMFQSGNRIFLR